MISLLRLIPVFGIVWAFVLGAKGKEWSWRYKKWDSVEDFKNTQRPWDIAGILLFAISTVALVAVIPAVLFPIFLFG